MSYLGEAVCASEFDPAIVHFTVDGSFKALDIDRTVLRTQAAVDVTLEAASEFGLSDKAITEIRDAQAGLEADGGTFEPLTHIEAALPDDVYVRFGDFLLSSRRGALAYPDADRLRDRLWTPVPTPHFYPTYGVSPLWQGIKAYLGDCRGEVIIMSHTDKGPLIDTIDTVNGRRTMRGVDAQGRTVAIYHATRGTTLVDDKNKSHRNLSADSSGNILWREDEIRLPSQGLERVVPPAIADRVGFISTLDEVEVGPIYASCFFSDTAEPVRDVSKIVAFVPITEKSDDNLRLIVGDTVSFADLRRQLQPAGSRA